MRQFEYERIGEPLIGRLVGLLREGESLVLLGPRNAGKWHLALRLRETITSDAGRRVAVESFRDTGQFGPGGAPPEPSEVLDRIDRVLADADGPCYLFACDLDRLPHAKLRRLLAELRRRMETTAAGGRRLVVVATGGPDLARLIGEIPSAFGPVRSFVIQGLDRDYFREYARRYIHALRAHQALPHGVDADTLYDRVGGNTYFMRLLLWSAIDHEAGGQAGPRAELFELTASGQSPAAYYFRAIADQIEADPSCWPDLESLIAHQPVPVPEDGSPHALELAGVAVREDGLLTMVAPLVRDYIENRYDDRKLADLYARVAKWKRAFEHFHRVQTKLAWARPSSIEDVPEADDVVKRLCTSLYQMATRNPLRVMKQFYRGCRLALGYGQVTHWRCQNREPELDRPDDWGPWEPARVRLFDTPGDDEQALRDLLGRIGPALEPKTIAEDQAQRDSVVVVGLPTSHPDVREVVVIGRPGEESIVSDTRRKITLLLAREFTTAYHHALEDQRLKYRMDRHQKFVKLACEITGRLGSEIRDIRSALEEAGTQLLGLGFRRAIFSVVDPGRRWIIPVSLKQDPEKYPGLPTEIPIQRTAYPLDDLDSRERSGSRWVVLNEEALVTRNAQKDPRVRQDVAEKLQIGAAAIVPMFEPTRTAIGTLHVERADGLTPTPEEVDDLIEFGRNLAVLLAVNEQLQMLQASLDNLPDVVVLFDRGLSLRYVNRSAGRRLGLKTGWFARGTGQKLEELELRFAGVDDASLRDLGADFQKLIEKVHQTNEGNPPLKRNIPTRFGSLAIQAWVRPLWDWRQEVERLGPAEARTGLLFVLTFPGWSRLNFRAIRPLLDASDTRQVLARSLQASQDLGHTWGLCYEVTGTTPRQLLAIDAYGLSDHTDFAPSSRDATDADPCHWYCFEERRPVIFTFDPSRDHLDPGTTDTGLPTVNCPSPNLPPDLFPNPGDLWIDVPLMTRERPIGKLTLACDTRIESERLELLEILCDLAMPILEGTTGCRRDLERTTQLYEDATTLGMHEALGRVGDQIAQLSPALTRERRALDELLGAIECTYLDPDGQRRQQARGRLDAARTRLDELQDEIGRKLLDGLPPEALVLPGNLADLFDVLRDDAEVVVEIPNLPGGPQADFDEALLLKGIGSLIDAARSPRVSASGFERDTGAWVRIEVTPAAGPPPEPAVHAARVHAGKFTIGDDSRAILEFPRFRAGRAPEVQP